MSPYLTLALGVLSAGIGGELFVRGTVSLATWARVAPGIVGATVAAFATSSPELSVSITSALAGTPQIALGDALGSNVVNIALILALALLISGIQSSRDSIRRDFPVAFLVPVLTAALAADGELSRLDGVVMLSIFLAWMIATVIEARRQRSAAEEVLGAHRLAPALLSAATRPGFPRGRRPADRRWRTGDRGLLWPQRVRHRRDHRRGRHLGARTGHGADIEAARPR